MKLVVDIGNSFIKFAVFSQNEMVVTKSQKQFDEKLMNAILEAYPGLQSAIVSNVRNDKILFLSKYTEKINIIQFSHTTPIPIKNSYKTPETLGKDRLAAAIGAHDMYPGENLLIIDAGTSITYDMVNLEGEYLGGSISPGIKMRFDALHTFTGKLPLIKPVWDKDIEMIGNTTEDAILSGVQFAVLREMEGMIEAYKQKFMRLKILLTGGDHIYFDKYLKNNIFAAPNLVLTGLKKILDFNEEA